jgi:hypothetical protein
MTVQHLGTRPPALSSPCRRSRSVGLIAALLSMGQIASVVPASAQYNPRQERRVNAQRIAPSEHLHQACPLFIRGERVSVEGMKKWRRNPACADRMREHNRKYTRSK